MRDRATEIKRIHLYQGFDMRRVHPFKDVKSGMILQFHLFFSFIRNFMNYRKIPFNFSRNLSIENLNGFELIQTLLYFGISGVKPRKFYHQ